MQAIYSYLLVQQHDGQVSIGLVTLLLHKLTPASKRSTNIDPRPAFQFITLPFPLPTLLRQNLGLLTFRCCFSHDENRRTKTNALVGHIWGSGGQSDVCRKAVEFCSSFWALVTTRTPKLHSASKSDTDPVRLWQTSHSTYCKSMYYHKGLGNILWRLKSYMLLL